MRRLSLSALWSAAALSYGVASAEQLVIVTNEQVSETSAELPAIRALFLKEESSWSDGSKAVPLDNRFDPEARRIFLAKVLQMSEVQLEDHWAAIKQQDGEGSPLTLRKQSTFERGLAGIEGAFGFMILTDGERVPEGSRIIFKVDG